jgi:hypothetical protein
VRQMQIAGPPRWGQIKCWTRMTGDVISLVAFFLAMLAIISLQVGGSVTQTQQHWTFIPYPPLLQAATWKGPNIPVYTNDSELVGGHADGHITPTFSSYNCHRTIHFGAIMPRLIVIVPSYGAYLEECSFVEWHPLHR